MAVAPLMNEEMLAQWILRRLGAPLLRVELTEMHLTDAIEDAKRWFSAKKGVKRQMLMQMSPGKVEYTLPDEVDTVLDVAFPVAPMDISMVFSPFVLIDDKVPYDVFAAPGSMGVYSSFTQTLQYVETAKRILGAEPDWRQEGRRLFIFPVPKNDVALWVDFKTNIVTIDQLNERDHGLVKRYALAKSKLDLAEIRGKYDSVPGAQGSATLNTGTLRDAGNTELAQLEEEISLSGYPMGFIVG
jgi:hypothetical protein